MAADRLSSKTWSAETLLRGFQIVADQPTRELLPSGDPELLRELQDFDCAKSFQQIPYNGRELQFHGQFVRTNQWL